MFGSERELRTRDYIYQTLQSRIEYEKWVQVHTNSNEQNSTYFVGLSNLFVLG